MNSSKRFSLLIDPQSQGINWIKEKEMDNGLKIGRLTDMKNLIKTLEIAIEAGAPVLIENVGESIDAGIASVYGRAFIKKGGISYMQIGDKEVALNPNFKLFLHTKLSNPHYLPEIQADCALINFNLTEQGLEDQLLSFVIQKERPELIQQKEELIQRQNKFKIELRQQEASSLHKLITGEGNILDNVALIENLESCKNISTKLQENASAVEEAKAQISDTSESYRPAAKKSALVFSLMSSLSKIHSFYKFSLDSFVTVINRAIDSTPEEADLKKRVEAMSDTICHLGFSYTTRSLFEKHRLLFATMLCLKILEEKGDLTKQEIDAFSSKEVPLESRDQPDQLKFIPES